MKLWIKIMLLMLALLIFYVFTVSLSSYIYSDSLEQFYNSAVEEEKNKFNNLVDLDGGFLKALANDYTFWDDMVEFATGVKEIEWAQENIDPALDTFNVDAVWVYNLNRELRYFINDREIDDIKEIPIPKISFENLYKDKRQNFFILSNQGPVEIRAATIHNTADPEKKTDPSGYFYVGRLWDRTYVANLSRISLTEVILSTSSQEPVITRDPQSARIEFIVPLYNSDKVPIRYLKITETPELLEGVINLLRFIFLLSIIFGLIGLTALFASLYYWVSKPMKLITQSAFLGDGRVITPLTRKKDEFGIIAGFMNSFFAQNRKTEELIDDIGVGIVAIDSSWKIILWNKTTERITGKNKAVALGKNFRDTLKFINEKTRKEKIDFISQTMTSGDVTHVYPGLILSLGEKEINISCTASPTYDPDHKLITGAVISFRDVTKQLQSEFMRSEFTYAQHQIRTPLTDAMVLLTLAGEEPDKKKATEYINESLNSVKSVIKLADRLIEVSNIEQGNVKARVGNFDLIKIIKESRQELPIPVINKQQEIELSGVKSAKIQSDGNLIKRVLHELLSNSILYGNNKSKLKINVSKESDGYLLQINNQGSPIPEQEWGLIFVKFFRASNRDQKVPGAGLGLFIAREYVKLIGGKIWFESNKKTGTTFYLSIPAKIRS